MADIVFAGGLIANTAGLLEGNPDIRLMLVGPDFTGAAEPEAVHFDDLTTIDEFGGAGYQRIDCANVVMAYDAGAHEMRITFDAAYFNADEDSGTVAADGDGWIGVVFRLHVDGTDASDYLLAFFDTGAGDGVGTAVLCTPHEDGPLYVGQAA